MKFISLLLLILPQFKWFFLSEYLYNSDSTSVNFFVSGFIVNPQSSPKVTLSRKTTTTTTTITECRASSTASVEEGGKTNAHSYLVSDASISLANGILEEMKSTNSMKTAKEWGDMFGLENNTLFYSLFSSIRSVASLGLKGQPFVLKHDDIVNALAGTDGDDVAKQFHGYFVFDDLAKAVEDDFLDATRGSTDNRKGWKATEVSRPRGSSFDESRMTLSEVKAALEKGTVIFNSAGAHIPSLAGPTLACTDATALPCASNLYVTAPDKRTSAPPHTDKQDVVIVQTSGKKHWRVYSPPNPAKKPMADCFARGKGDDNLPLHALEGDQLGCELLLETTLDVGDVLFIPAAFPHTTGTVFQGDDINDSDNYESRTSIHLTFNFDSHIWDLDYLSARQLALRRSCISDTALGQVREKDNRYVGRCNELSKNVRDDLFDALPLGLLDELDENRDALVDTAVSELQRISNNVDSETASMVDSTTWRETIDKLQQHGMELFDIHRDMYLAAHEEGKKREAEDAMTAHLEKSEPRKKAMTPERMQRLSVFRVKKYFEKINESKKDLLEWSLSGKPSTAAAAAAAAAASENSDTVQATATTTPSLPENWAFTLPIQVGDEVEADLGGAYFPAKVTRISGDGSSYDVQFFDGDKETGLERSMLKLLTPPKASTEDIEPDFSTMTKKQIKRWKKEQEKKNK